MTSVWFTCSFSKFKLKCTDPGMKQSGASERQKTGMKLLSLLVFFMWPCLRDTAEGITTAKRGSENIQPSKNVQDFLQKFFENSKRHQGSPLPPRLNLVFILDSSSSVSSKQFMSLKVLIQSLVSGFSVSPSTTRVGLILCSENPSLEFAMNEFVNKECTVKAMKKARFVGGHQCNLVPSLEMARRMLFQSRKSTSLRYRPKPIIFILSASPLVSNSRTLLALKKLKDFKTEMFFISLGNPLPKSDKYQSIFTNWFHYLTVTSLSEFEDHLVEVVKSKGLNPQSCHTTGTVYDECGRRCQCSNGRMIDCYRVRKEFTSMILEERRLYIHTIKTVSTLSPYKQSYDILTSYHPRWFDHVHRLKYFFPWHRWFIFIFENFLREIDCRVTVPYWDWSRAVSDGRLWRTGYLYDIWYPGPHGIGGNGQGKKKCVKNGPFREGAWTLSASLNKSCLTREFNDCYAADLPNRTDTESYLALPYEEFQTFEENVREGLHDTFHNAVGGVMSWDESANAPEFWFHHAFLDKTWSDWQERGHKFKYQYFPGVRSNLPGTIVKGVDFIDLFKQPLCVQVKYDPVIDFDFPDNKLNPKVKPAQAIYDCGDETEVEDEENYENDDTQTENGN